MTALLVGKVLLLGFLLVAIGVLVVTYVRRRRKGVQPWVNPQASPYLDVYRGSRTPILPPATNVAERSADGQPPASETDSRSAPEG
jgi:hypothetical protein